MSESRRMAAVPPSGAPDNFPRTLFFTMQEPDFPSGSPAILADILERWPAEKASVLCQLLANPATRRQLSLPHPLKRLRLLSGLWRMRRGDRVRKILWVLSWPFLVLAGLREVRRTRAELIFTIYTDGLWILAAHCVSKLSGRPLLLYVHDAWRERVAHQRPILDRLASIVERSVLESASVVVLSEGLGELYRRRYGIDSVLVRHLATGARFDGVPRYEGLTLGFAGAIYGNNLAQLQDLVRVVEATDRWKLLLFTGTPDARLAELGLVGRNVSARFVADQVELRRCLSECDALYLPLAFEDAPDMPTSLLRHAIPTKMIDYLMSGAPILVHCPADFEMARLLERSGFGIVCSNRGAEELGAVLARWSRDSVSEGRNEKRGAALSEFSPGGNFARLLAVAGKTAFRARG